MYCRVISPTMAQQKCHSTSNHGQILLMKLFRHLPFAVANSVGKLFIYLRITLVVHVFYGTYTGHVFRPTDAVTQFDRIKYGDEDDDDEEEPKKTTWESGETFDSLTIWEHHTLPDGKQDHWIRGIEEWIAMADAVAQS